MAISRQTAYTNVNGLSTANLKSIGTAAVDAYVALAQLGVFSGGSHASDPRLVALATTVRTLVASGDDIAG